MKVEDFLEGENPITGEEVSPSKVPKLVIGGMMVILAITGSQFLAQKLVNLSGAQDVQESVPEV